MYAVLKSNITLGDYTFTQVNNVEIKKSVDTLSDSAIITMPTSFILKNNNAFTSVNMEDALKVGDKVFISLGYDGIVFRQEFAGYVKKIKPNIPLEIECEDAIFLIRRKTINKLFVNAELRDVLAEIIAGTGVELSSDIPDLKLERFLLKNVNGAKALQKIKEEFGLSIYINDDGKLFAGLQQQLNAIETVKYHLQRQTITEENDLEFTKAEDVQLQIKAVGIASDNTRIEVQVGDTEGEQRTLHFYNVNDAAKLKEIAESKLQQMKYTGYKGTLTSFLFPVVDRGWSADIKDSNYLDREGSYFVPTIEITYGENGARRIITLGSKL